MARATTKSSAKPIASARPAAARPAASSTALPANSAVDLASNTKRAMIDLCNARLAEAIDLALITKQAHWNIKGPTFIAVHLLLDDLRTQLDEHVDIIAERVAQLDGIALGTAQAVGENTSLAAFTLSTVASCSPLAIFLPTGGSSMNTMSPSCDCA